MLAKSLATAVLAITVANSAPVKKRDGATILSDLETIGTTLSTLESAVSSWSGSLLTALGILVDYDDLSSDLTTAISDTEATTSLTDAESSSITDEIVTLGPSIVATLDVIIEKESVASDDGLKSDLLSALETLQTKTNELGADLEDLATSTDAETIASVISSVDAAFASATAAYS